MGTEDRRRWADVHYSLRRYRPRRANPSGSPRSGDSFLEKKVRKEILEVKIICYRVEERMRRKPCSAVPEGRPPR